MVNQDVSVEWIKHRNILALPQGWQRPAKTEEWAYEQCLRELPETIYFQLVCFPWATLIDLLRKGKKRKASLYLDQLTITPPPVSLIRATVCQHIYASDMLPWFKRLKITDLYWSHAKTGETSIDGIRIHPFPLYPVQCGEYLLTDGYATKPLVDRRYLYSFIGAYDTGLYLSPVRQWLFNLPAEESSYIKYRSQWHYENQVYHEQIAGLQCNESSEDENRDNSREYSEVMKESIFSLCPSGSGPNSIRIWESLGFGCIPVILSDSLQLPGDSNLWNKAVIRISETEESVKRLPALLQDLIASPEKLAMMQEAGRDLWELYGKQGPITILGEMSRLDVVRSRVDMS